MQIHIKYIQKFSKVVKEISVSDGLGRQLPVLNPNYNFTSTFFFTLYFYPYYLKTKSHFAHLIGALLRSALCALSRARLPCAPPGRARLQPRRPASPQLCPPPRAPAVRSSRPRPQAHRSSPQGHRPPHARENERTGSIWDKR